MTYQGAPRRETLTVKDSGGTLVDPTTVAASLARPAPAAPVAYAYNPGAIVRDSVGAFHVDIPATDMPVAGHHQLTWSTTGPGAGVIVTAFDLRDPAEVIILSVQDAKDMLNIPQTTTSYDAEIQTWLDTIVAGLERMTGGPIVNRSIVERVASTEGGSALMVRARPLVSVTSVVDIMGSTQDLSTVDIDTNAGVIRRRLGVPWLGGSGVYTVTFVAGWGTSVPAPFPAAARIIVDHLWQTQRGPSARPALGGLDDVTMPGMGYAIPNRAAELISPYMAEAFV